jgi:hypothetical protein
MFRSFHERARRAAAKLQGECDREFEVVAAGGCERFGVGHGVTIAPARTKQERTLAVGKVDGGRL